MVANVLLRLGYDPVWQDIFGTESGDLRQMLREKLDDCDGLIQLVGRGYGAEPPTIGAEFAQDGFTRVSYTQFEFLYARARGKKTWLIYTEEGCTLAHPLEELDLPPRTGAATRVVADAASVGSDAGSIRHDHSIHPDPTGYQSERRALQEAWRLSWKQKGHAYYEASDDTELQLTVERLKDEFAELRQAFQLWQRGVAALVLSSVGIGLYVARQQQETEKRIEHAQDKIVQALTDPATLAETIRKQIHVTAGDKIKMLPDERGRWQKVAEIEKERDLALGRVDDLIKLIQEELKDGASPVFQRASEILNDAKNGGTDEALAYLENRRPSTLETARCHAEQAKASQATPKRRRNAGTRHCKHWSSKPNCWKPNSSGNSPSSFANKWPKSPPIGLQPGTTSAICIAQSLNFEPPKRICRRR